MDSLRLRAYARNTRGKYMPMKLMKQNKKGKNCAVFCFAGKKNYYFIYYAVIVKQKIYKRSTNHYCNMHWIIFERSAKRGEEIDASAPAIYPTHVDKISEAFMKEGSDHSAIVNITLLTTLYSGARPCEPEYLSLWGMQDDDEFRVTKGPLPQIKTKKTKVYSIPPAVNRHRSWHLGWGDFLTLVHRQPVEAEEDEFGEKVPDTLGIIPELQQGDNPGTWLGNQLKALLPVARGGSAR